MHYQDENLYQINKIVTPNQIVNLKICNSCAKMPFIGEGTRHPDCVKQCLKLCGRGHYCGKQHVCTDPCPPCTIRVCIKLLCGHSRPIFCYACQPDVIVIDPGCTEKCNKLLPCGHICCSGHPCKDPCGQCQIKVEPYIHPFIKNFIVQNCYHQQLPFFVPPLPPNQDSFFQPSTGPPPQKKNTLSPQSKWNANAKKRAQILQELNDR